MAGLINFNPVQLPQANAVVPNVPGTRMPGNIAREDYLAKRLDPNSPTWVGLGARSANTAASSDLQQSLKGYGNFDFAPQDAFGVRQVTEAGGNPGELYRRAELEARAQANAAGMLGSSFSDAAVGTAWNRLSQERRALLNQYAKAVSTNLNSAQSAATEVTNQLMDLYGADIQYALENPATVPASPAPASAPAVAQPTAQNSLIGKQLASGTIVGVYDKPPNDAKIKERFGADASVRRTGTGKYIVLRKGG